MMACVVVTRHQQSCQTLIFQITSHKLRSYLAPGDSRPDVRDLVQSSYQGRRMLSIKHKNRKQGEAIQEPRLEDANQALLCRRQAEKTKRQQHAQQSATRIAIG